MTTRKKLLISLQQTLDKEFVDVGLAKKIVQELLSIEKEYECPLNEFSEHCTADMPSADKMLHIMFNPEKSEFPEIAKKNKEYWLRMFE